MIPADMIDAWLVFWVGSGQAREKCSDPGPHKADKPQFSVSNGCKIIT